VGELKERFPLFPLGIVLLPTEVIPLHIFEERYKLMIGECVENDQPFGIVWLSDDGLKDIGCTAHVSQVLDEFDDGRMNVLVAGARPFRLLRRIDDMPYPAGDIELLETSDEPDEALGLEARERYADLVEQVTDERPAPDDLEDLDAFGMAATIEFDAAAKQELLELPSEESRLRHITELFATTVKRIEEKERAGELAKSNGKIRF
jgi:Lon protease-like protein